MKRKNDLRTKSEVAARETDLPFFSRADATQSIFPAGSPDVSPRPIELPGAVNPLRRYLKNDRESRADRP